MNENPVLITEWTAVHERWAEAAALIAHLEQTEWVAFVAEWHKSNRLLVAFTPTEVVGFLRVVRQAIGAEEDWPPLMLNGRPLYEGKVLAFGVAPTHRRQGVGRRLQETAVALCRAGECHQLRSHSSLDNRENYRLKLAMGFAIHPLVTTEQKDGAYFILPLQGENGWN